MGKALGEARDSLYGRFRERYCLQKPARFTMVKYIKYLFFIDIVFYDSEILYVVIFEISFLLYVYVFFFSCMYVCVLHL